MKKGITCQENGIVVITNSNRAYFANVVGCWLQEEALRKLLADYTYESIV